MCMIDSVGVPGKPTRKFSGFTSLVIILGWFASCAFIGILNLKQGFRGCLFDWHPKCSTCKRDPRRAPFSAYQAPVEGVKLRNINWSCLMSIAANNINGPGIQSWRRCLSWTFQQAAKPSAPQGLDQATPTPAKFCDHLASKVQNQRMEDWWWVTPARIWQFCPTPMLFWWQMLINWPDKALCLKLQRIWDEESPGSRLQQDCDLSMIAIINILLYFM